MHNGELDSCGCGVQSGHDLAQNLAMRALCAQAARNGARLLLLPENFAFFGPSAASASTLRCSAEVPSRSPSPAWLATTAS